MIPGHHPIQTGLVSCHLLVAEGEAVLVDTGLFGAFGAVRRQLARLGLPPGSLKAILLTHGHLDHAGNAARLRDWSGARVHAHPADQRHLDGRYPYAGLVRWCGRLEAIGRRLARYRPPPIDVPLMDGQVLPFWGGLRVVHLPGHTAGHCGFLSERHRLLFVGDLFASYRPHASVPPPIFNTHPELIPASLERARRLGADGMVPAHYFGRNWARHRRKLDALSERVQARRASGAP